MIFRRPAICRLFAIFTAKHFHLIAITERLKIEEATLDDAPFFHHLLTSPSWLRYIGDRGIVIRADALNYIETRLITSYRENGFGLYKVTIRKTEEPIGVCGFLKREYLDSPDIGYALLPYYEGKGYMAEAAEAVLAYGRISLGLSPIYAFTEPGNEKSRRLLVKLGMYEIRTFKPADFDSPCILFSDHPDPERDKDR